MKPDIAEILGRCNRRDKESQWLDGEVSIELRQCNCQLRKAKVSKYCTFFIDHYPYMGGNVFGDLFVWADYEDFLMDILLSVGIIYFLCFLGFLIVFMAMQRLTYNGQFYLEFKDRIVEGATTSYSVKKLYWLLLKSIKIWISILFTGRNFNEKLWSHKVSANWRWQKIVENCDKSIIFSRQTSARYFMEFFTPFG